MRLEVYRKIMSSSLFTPGQGAEVVRHLLVAELRALLAAFVAAFEWTMADPEERVIRAIVITAKP